MTSVGSKFLCGRPHGADPSTRPHASIWAWPLCKWMAPYLILVW